MCFEDLDVLNSEVDISDPTFNFWRVTYGRVLAWGRSSLHQSSCCSKWPAGNSEFLFCLQSTYTILYPSQSYPNVRFIWWLCRFIVEVRAFANRFATAATAPWAESWFANWFLWLLASPRMCGSNPHECERLVLPMKSIHIYSTFSQMSMVVLVPKCVTVCYSCEFNSVFVGDCWCFLLVQAQLFSPMSLLWSRRPSSWRRFQSIPTWSKSWRSQCWVRLTSSFEGLVCDGHKWIQYNLTWYNTILCNLIWYKFV